MTGTLPVDFAADSSLLVGELSLVGVFSVPEDLELLPELMSCVSCRKGCDLMCVVEVQAGGRSSRCDHMGGVVTG